MHKTRKDLQPDGIQISTLAIVLLLLSPGTESADEPFVTSSNMVGGWNLVEWHHEGKILRPPTIGGSYSLTDGLVMWIVFRKTEHGEVSQQCFGTYELDQHEFHYSYDRCSETVVENDDVSFEAGPWAASPFTIVENQARLVLIDANHEFGFELAGDRLTYSENGKPLRVYQRID